MFRRSVALLAAALALTLALPASAQWKWRDKTGQTQYSDLPPPLGVAEQDILQRPQVGQRKGQAAAAPAAPASGASGAAAAPLQAAKASEPELEAKRKKAEQEEAAKKKAEDTRQAAVRAEACTRAQGNLRTFDAGVRVSRTNDKGEREYLDDAARAAETRRARDIIATQCK
jgi:hypothetical protein